mmetsp:Transcript_29156/g.67602  ORF Transcript_29156/g.67602 Transcript_29156/m.67602 type:complete len:256 (-) Transcript_29156:71-838(-)|eukprot:CAMPEP_0116852722 /NCGR_PEP_ID=MMETSP0418-20121206/17478_1 /TAXON_ID=1158023 /ORGANISM="Astrosyne radiata, Strain 13vi08-1A" /LENGTH=255 /DNA_ID=CAMNT_0004484971 /DNA_START=140 /DNA_END=907 /DNA_ORIENTATION=+
MNIGRIMTAKQKQRNRMKVKIRFDDTILLDVGPPEPFFRGVTTYRRLHVSECRLGLSSVTGISQDSMSDESTSFEMTIPMKDGVWGLHPLLGADSLFLYLDIPDDGSIPERRRRELSEIFPKGRIYLEGSCFLKDKENEKRTSSAGDAEEYSLESLQNMLLQGTDEDLDKSFLQWAHGNPLLAENKELSDTLKMMLDPPESDLVRSRIPSKEMLAIREDGSINTRVEMPLTSNADYHVAGLFFIRNVDEPTTTTP